MNFSKKCLSFFIVLLMVFSLFTLPLSVNAAKINKIQSGETTDSETTDGEATNDEASNEELPTYEYIVLDDGTAEISAYYGYDMEVAIPDTIDGYTVTSIGESAFAGAMMETLTIPEGITNIADYAFESCCDLSSVVIPDSVTSIGASAFFSCSLLTDITLGANLTYIGAEAFLYCESLTTVHIPANVQIIGDNAFAFCSCLESFTVDENNLYFYAADGVLFNGNQTCLITYPQAKTDLTSYDIPDTVIIIGVNAFANSCLEEITIPEGVINIGNNAFDSCYNIMSITTPESLISIGEYAFTNCTCLEQITLGSNLRNIGVEAFSFCESLGTLEIPASVTYIGDHALKDTESLSSITVASENTMYSSKDGVLFNKDKTVLISCPQSLETVDSIYTVPDTVIEINEYSFYSNNYLWEIYVPDSVITIENNAFDSCYETLVISLGNSVETIGNYAFSECYNIIEINLPDSLTSIGSGAFYYCNIIESITIPDGVTEIESHSFDQCEFLTSLTIGKNVTTIGYGAFNNCYSLETVVIPDSVTTIDGSAFYNCEALKEVTFGKNVGTIQDSAFANCLALTTVTFPDALTSIGDYAFENCNALTSATISYQVENIGWDAFYNCSELTIYGYNGSVANIYADENNITFVGKDKTGFIEEQGQTYYYENGNKTYAGLIKIGDNYYYVNSSCVVVKDKTYFISKTNGIFPAAYYDFDSEGKMINVPTIEKPSETPTDPSDIKNGIVVENEQLYYYKNNTLTYAGLIKIDGYFYYVNSSCKVVTNANYYISKTNNLLPNGGYLFGSDGKMLNPPKMEETVDENLTNGIINENGELYYYFNGKKKHAGLVMIDGNFYYANSDGKIITGMSYYISKTNGYCERGSYYFDEQGRLTNASITLPEPKNGIVTENGLKYYYINGAKNYAGLIKIDNDYYYVNSSCIVVTNTSYYVSKNNGLLPSGSYEFDIEGKIVGAPHIEDTLPDDSTVKNGIIKENNALYYYVNDVKTYAGIVVIDGSYYYANSSGRIITGTSYYISKTNDKLQAGIYTFDENGVMDINSLK